MTTERQIPGPTLDSELYNFATLRIEERCREEILGALDSEGLARWFGGALRDAYTSGLRDGYAQGRHDRHREGAE
jgi:hypothetical protein